ncbi:unnamed protein product [Sphagnum jensenii]|uniref:PX domain-containing protein n=1 Tax=Sphagnum jensenii TaxID=128206 RepID=A0ABP0XB18_9BRYO
MMGSEEDEGRLYTSTDMMESLTLDTEPHPFLSNSDYRNAMSGGDSFFASSLQESHPLAAKSVDAHQLGFEDSARSSGSLREDMVEPPSYADAVFARDLSHNTTSTFLQTNSFSDVLRITVSNPQKIPEAGASMAAGIASSYVTYLINTHTNISSYQGSDFSVRRRFRDVVTLSDRLAESFRGFFIPPRPDKNVVESQVMQKHEFIENRRAALEKYLRRLAAHPVLRQSDELRLFLQVEGKLPLLPTTDMASRMLDGAVNLPRQLFGEGSVILTPQEAAQPAKGGRDLVRLFKELKQSVTNDWGGSKPAIIEEDKEFLEKKEKLQDLEHHLSDASQQAELVVKAQQEVGEVMGELGLAFIKLAKFETRAGFTPAHAADAKCVATGAVKASRFYRECNAQSVRHLDELHEYLGLMQALHIAFADRSNALLTVQTFMSDVAANNMQIEKLEAASNKVFGGSKTQNRKISELKEAVKVTGEARDLAQKEYECIKEHNRAELERFEEERQRDFFNMLRGFAQTQVGYAEKICNVWTKVAEDTKGHSGGFSEATPSYLSTPT